MIILKQLIDKENKKIRVHKLKENQVGIIYTKLYDYEQKSLDKTTKIIRSRLQSLGSIIKQEVICDHDEKKIASNINEMINEKNNQHTTFNFNYSSKCC